LVSVLNNRELLLSVRTHFVYLQEVISLSFFEALCLELYKKLALPIIIIIKQEKNTKK
jgi:hypothetical protein